VNRKAGVETSRRKIEAERAITSTIVEQLGCVLFFGERTDEERGGLGISTPQFSSTYGVVTLAAVRGGKVLGTFLQGRGEAWRNRVGVNDE
jgi:hypothetical protein